MFNHEPELLKELEKLKAKLAESPEAEKESADKKAEDDKTEDRNTAPKGETMNEESAAKLNGDTNDISPKGAMSNGVPSLDSDATAVNTPDGASTPTKETLTSVTMESVTDEDAVGVTVLRLQVQHLEKLTKFLEKEFGPTRQKLKDLAATGEIKFNLLWALFRLGSVITFRDNESGLVMAGEVSMRKDEADDRLLVRITCVEEIHRNISISKPVILTITDPVSTAHGNDCTHLPHYLD